MEEADVIQHHRASLAMQGHRLESIIAQRRTELRFFGGDAEWPGFILHAIHVVRARAILGCVIGPPARHSVTALRQNRPKSIKKQWKTQLKMSKRSHRQHCKCRGGLVDVSQVYD